MNEYQGFKVSDKIEITTLYGEKIQGRITKFGDRKVGGCAEPDTLEVWLNGTSSFDLPYYIRNNKIEKLPKFSVGDEIWTLKRGKGKIVADLERMPRRFKVVFDADKNHPTIICRHPKLSNLLTEAEYNNRHTGYGFKIDVGYVTEYKAKPLHLGKLKWYTDNMVCGIKESLYSQLAITEKGVCKYKSKFGMGELVSYAGCIRAVVDRIHFNEGKFTYDLRTNECPSGVPEYSLSAVVEPKFKAGDVVFYDNLLSNNKKWVVLETIGVATKLRQIDGDRVRECCPNESKLRLWVDTRLTHGLASNGLWVGCGGKDYPINPTWKLTYLGKVIGYDTFLCESKGAPELFRGIKGDDI